MMKSAKFSFTRLQNEEKNINEDFELKKSRKLQENILAASPIFTNGMKDLYNWKILIKGRENTIFEGGKYPISLIFDENFPMNAPKIKFPQDFQHIHVYEDGMICLPLLSENNWKSQYDLIYILNSIENLIHNSPKINSPANQKLLEIYMNDYQQYVKIIREQAEKYG